MKFLPSSHDAPLYHLVKIAPLVLTGGGSLAGEDGVSPSDHRISTLIANNRMVSKEFVTKLNKGDHSKTASEKFRDFCEMAYCALAKLTAPEEEAEVLEARYLNVVNGYPKKEAVQAYPKLMALVFQGITNGEDVLGTVAMEVGAFDAKLGQFPTPYNVCRMMAGIGLGDAKAEIEQKGFVTLMEPSVGSGAMLIAAADVLHTQGFDPETQLLVHATDIGELCYHISFVQASLKGIPGYIERGDSLTGEHFAGAWTPATILFHKRHGCLFPQEEENDITPPKPPRLDVDFDGKHMPLF